MFRCKFVVECVQCCNTFDQFFDLIVFFGNLRNWTKWMINTQFGSSKWILFLVVSHIITKFMNCLCVLRPDFVSLPLCSFRSKLWLRCFFPRCDLASWSRVALSLSAFGTKVDFTIFLHGFVVFFLFGRENVVRTLYNEGVCEWTHCL